MNFESDRTNRHATDLPEPAQIADAVGFLYLQRKNIADDLRAGRKERFLAAFDELIAMHIEETVTLDDLIQRESDFQHDNATLYRRIANRLHRRHSRAREDMLNWICRQEKFGRHRDRMPAARADQLRWCITTTLCDRQSSRRVARALGLQ